MPAKLGVEVADRKYRTTAVNEVEVVGMPIGACPGPEIEVCTAKDATGEVSPEAGVTVGEGVQCSLVVFMKFRLEIEEAFCNVC